VHRDKLESTLGWIAKNGLPNYFGSQRFGVNGDNFLEGKKIVEHQLKIRDRKAREFLISAYQSYLFNNWLSKRIELSRVLKSFSVDEVEQIFTLPKDSLAGVKNQQNFFKLLSGDVMMHYPFGRIFYLEDLAKESERFLAKDTAPTGLICGKKAKRAEGVASTFEKSFEDGKIAEQGGRRYAWIFPEDISSRYLPEKAHFELEFTLPKGSYATILVDFLRGRE
jgi:tRNA pseudouridine13 synthase